MEKLILPKIPKKSATINRTIRFDGDIYDELNEMSEGSGMNFNRLVNHLLRFAIDNTEMEKEENAEK